MLPIFIKPYDLEQDECRPGIDPFRQQRFSTHRLDSSPGSHDPERIVAGLWFQSQIKNIANLKGSHLSREIDHA